MFFRHPGEQTQAMEGMISLELPWELVCGGIVLLLTGLRR